MDTGERQKELFREYEEKGAHYFKVPHHPLARPTSISVPLERIIFISIGVLMALVIVYALGVERGKAISRREVRVKPAAKIQAAAAAQEALAAKRPVPQAEGVRPYAVLLATFRQRTLADAEVMKLRKEGYTPFLTAQGEYLRLYAGRFASLEDAARVQNALKARYKDSSIKKF